MSKYTIIYTDVVGYSKLTGENQELALEILSEHDKILHQNTKHYSGKIVKKTGDGICALFNDVSNALKCCIDIQKDLQKRNKLNIKERKVFIRIGVHYGSVLSKDNDYFGDDINIANFIESKAPHGGIAISSSVNDLLWDSNDIYIRNYITVEYEGSKLILYEVYLDLLEWYKNEKNQNSQQVDFDKTYKIAHDFFHNGNYSAAIKFAALSLNSLSENKFYEVSSFICNSFISIGDFEYAKKEIEKLKNNKSDDVTIELEAQLFKMEGLLSFNNKEWVTAEKLLKNSFDLMNSVNKKYINEIIFYIGNIYLNNHDIDKLEKFLESVEIQDDYKVLINGIKLASLDNEDENSLNKYLEEIECIRNEHLKSIGLWYLAIYFNNFKNFKNTEKYLTSSYDLLVSSADNISDWFQREKFLKNIYIHQEIENFSDSNILIFEDMDISNEDNSSDDILNIYKFCPSCGNENKNSYKFCINCGNDLQY